MAGTGTKLTNLEARRRLLLAESEVNRVQLQHEWAMMAGEVRALADRAGGVLTTVKTVASLGMAGFQAVRNFRANHPKGTSWISTALTGLRLGSSLWKSFRSKSD